MMEENYSYENYSIFLTRYPIDIRDGSEFSINFFDMIL